jgi:hypothetical protein
MAVGAFLADGNEASSHDLALILSREDSFIDRGIKETLESAHAGHTQSSPIFRIVALQKHDPHSTKCMLEVLLSSIKFFIVWLFVRICHNPHAFNLIFLAKDEHVDGLILYSVYWIYFLSAL